MRNFILTAAAVALVASAAKAETIYGITNLQQLVSFDSNTRVATVLPLTGFSIAGEQIWSIDVRPATGELYGLSNQNRIYKLNPTTGTPTLVGGPTTPALTGTLRALDFNPTVDRIRLLGSSGDVTNLRVHPDTGALAMEDGDHAFAAGDPNAGETPAVVNGAYTNSDNDPLTGTTLYVLEANNDILATQNPPNNGTLNTVGALGSNLATSGGFTGFDISGTTGTAYLVGNNLAGGLTANSLYTVNLTTGSATLLGSVSGISGSFRDIAVAPPAAVPEPSSLLMVLACIGGFAIRRRLRS